MNETTFRANFHYNTIYQKHENSAIGTKEFHLKENEAVIEYQKNNRKYLPKKKGILFKSAFHDYK